jgi:hypothetical protein
VRTNQRPGHPPSFLTPDPAGRLATCPYNPQTQNRYVYVADNPLNHTDPSGLCGDLFSGDCGGINIWFPVIPTGGGTDHPAAPTPHPIFGDFFRQLRPLSAVNPDCYSLCTMLCAAISGPSPWFFLCEAGCAVACDSSTLPN